MKVELTRFTVPWNTCAIWDVNKLTLTGFLLISEGLHRAEEGGCEDGTTTMTSTDAGAAGVEEVARSLS